MQQPQRKKPDARTSKAERTRATTEALLDIAARHFGAYGYGGVSTEAIVQEAGVTRGALYHHFDGKMGLFEAVVVRKQTEAAAFIEEQARNAATPWEGFLAGCRAWLSASTDPDFQRIVITDAPAVLGWGQWQRIDEQHGALSLREGLDELVQSGDIDPPSVEALTILLNGALNQAALWIARSSEPRAALRDAENTLRVLLEGMRVNR